MLRVWLRAAVMLATLVGLPAAWVYWGPLPPEAQRVVDRWIERAKTSFRWQAERQWTAWLAPATQPRSPTASRHAPPPWIRAVPASRNLPAAPAVRRGGDDASSPQPEQVADLEPLLEALRGLGAAEYELQHWGSSGRLYRFRCAMALNASDEHTQHFEAVAEDPRMSVAQVLSEATQWRHARRGDRVLRR